jgi:hydrogenase maturation protease
VVLVIGVGNPDRGDDGSGPAVAALVPGAIAVGGELADLLDAWSGHEDVVVVDAMVSGRPPGTVVYLDAVAHGLPSGFSSASSHALGLADAVELARALGRLPLRLTIIGIEVESCALGERLSARVAAAVESVAMALGAGASDPHPRPARIR